MNKTRHLDIGCGARPRNPYGCDEVFGVDLGRSPAVAPEFFRAANLATGPIPFEDNFFRSLSAYDFLEHVPRILPNGDGSTRAPFVLLMNEIWRVLEPNGKFYAVTPAYPRAEAFADPTHVNIIAEDTYLYFTEPHNWAKMYGFTGRFRVIRMEWTRIKFDYEPPSPDLRHRLRRIADKVKGRQAHLLWEFAAVKD